MLSELHDTLLSKFRWSEERATRAIAEAASAADLVTPTLSISACRDPDDNRVLECALSGGASCIVTGDADLLTLHPFQGIRIITPRQFLDEFTRLNPVP